MDLKGSRLVICQCGALALFRPDLHGTPAVCCLCRGHRTLENTVGTWRELSGFEQHNVDQYIEENHK